MRQLTCIAPSTVEWRDVPEPQLGGDHEALVRPIAVARCEIDPVLTSGALGASEPFALGHEGVAEVRALGDGVRGLRIGQHVVVSFQVSCGACGPCRASHSGNCARYPVLSDYGMQPLSGTDYGGFLSDLVRVPHAEAMLHPVPEGVSPVNIASASDNVLDGYRAVAPHLEREPGAEVLFVCHGSRSIALYGVQAALALGAGRVVFASDDPDALALAERLGAEPAETDFRERIGRFAIVVDCGNRPEGLTYALNATAPEGTCQSVSYYPQRETPMPLGKLYTLGIRFFIGRAHAASLLPEVMPLLADGRLHPERVTTRVADWEQAPEAFVEDTVKLVIARRDG